MRKSGKLQYDSYVDQEISRYVDRLRLSRGELLALAREVAEDAGLRTIDDLTMHQRLALVRLLASLEASCAGSCAVLQ